MRFRHNVMSVTAIDTFESIKGGINRQCKDVYFVRAVGTSPTYINDIRKMDDTLDGCSQSGRGYYRRLGSLPKLQNTEDTAFYAERYAKWTESGRQEAVIRTTMGSAELAKLLGSACSAVEDICMREEMRMTDSIRKNFIIKLLFWYDSVFDKEDFVWDERESIKIVADNIEKKQEYLFFYLLTLTGCDVLLLQSRADIGADEEKLGLSGKTGSRYDSKPSQPFWPFRSCRFCKSSGLSHAAAQSGPSGAAGFPIQWNGRRELGKKL